MLRLVLRRAKSLSNELASAPENASAAAGSARSSHGNHHRVHDRVHRQLGPGLLKSAYGECLCHQLHLRGIEFQRQVSLPLFYEGLPLSCGHQMDLIARDEAVVELKAIENFLPVHQAQLLTFMKLARKSVGLLINFNVPVLLQGVAPRVL